MSKTKTTAKQLMANMAKAAEEQQAETTTETVQPKVKGTRKGIPSRQVLNALGEFSENVALGKFDLSGFNWSDLSTAIKNKNKGKAYDLLSTTTITR